MRKTTITLIALCCPAHLLFPPTAPAAGGSKAKEEARLIEVITGDSEWKEIDGACRRLRIIGTEQCIPALASLLTDEKLSHIARFGLENMPYPAVDAALRKALEKARGMPRLGIIQSIGIRRDQKAVGALTGLLKSGDPQTAGEAACALGRIATPAAVKALAGFRGDCPEQAKPDAAAASLLAAEQLLADGNKDEAAAIYTDLQAAAWPKQVRVGAFAGLLFAEPKKAVARITAAIAGDDPEKKGAAIAAIAKLEGKEVVDRFAAELPGMEPAVQVLVIDILADRGGDTAREAILKVGKAAKGQVRIAAAEALADVGDASCVPWLAEVAATAADGDTREAARRGLLMMDGAGVNEKLCDCMAAADAPVRPRLIELLAQRGEASAVKPVMKQAAESDARVRRAAFAALGTLLGPGGLESLIDLLVASPDDPARAAAEKAVMKVALKRADNRAAPVLAALAKAEKADVRCSLIRILGGIGGEKALAAAKKALDAENEDIRDAAVRSLASWPDAAAAPLLLDIFQTTENKVHHVLALRGLVQVLGTARDLSPAETAGMYGKAFEKVETMEETKMLLGGLGEAAHPKALELVAPYLQRDAVRSEAEMAAVSIAEAIMSSARGEAVATLKKLASGAKNGGVRKRAARLLKTADSFGDYIMAWRVAGPYRKSGAGIPALLKTPFRPEKKGGDAAWQKLPLVSEAKKPFILSLAKALGGERCVAYVRTAVYSEQTRTARLEIGVDDAVMVWLNDAPVHKNPETGAATPGEEKVAVTLKKGWNTLLIKVVQDTGPWEFCARFRAPDRTPLPGLTFDASRGAPLAPAGNTNAGGASAAADTAAWTAGDWTPLFNGKNLDNWKETGHAVFRVEDGCLLGTQTGGKGGDLWTKSTWDNFEVAMTYRVAWPANSGLWFRHDGKKGYQFDILKYKKPVAFSGTLYCPGKMFITRNLDESLENRDGWNEARIRAAGGHLTLWLNGKKVGDCRDDTLQKGTIGIQVHGGNQFKGMKIYFKEIKIRPLAPAAAKGPAGAKGAAGPVAFTARKIGDYRSEACNVGDFNGDGKPDIVAGPYWYEAPEWTPHRFRELRGKVDDNGKGYRDDFMNAPVDVDGDGKTDLVSCCWFAKRMEWYRNTGGGNWPLHPLPETGNHECGDLVDLDGDGKAAEILPAIKKTTWYEVGTTADGTTGLVCRDVGGKPGPFGCGVGDINGDGRNDIIRPHAWYEAPKDLRGGTWKEHPIVLGCLKGQKPQHTPQILVCDVDGDGHNDIITSNAHKYGIFWYRQERTGGRIAWKKNIIDKTWSQAHSLALGDIDGDGIPDLVTGKRFMAHNGGDPGSSDPIGVYWYRLTRKGGPRWTRHVISHGKGIGAGLNIPVTDMDGDGDLDIVVTGKWGGPVLFENMTNKS